MKNPKIINVKLENEEVRKLRVIAAEKEVSRSEIVRQAIIQYINGYKFEGISLVKNQEVNPSLSIPQENLA